MNRRPSHGELMDSALQAIDRITDCLERDLEEGRRVIDRIQQRIEQLRTAHEAASRARRPGR